MSEQRVKYARFCKSMIYKHYLSILSYFNRDVFDQNRDCIKQKKAEPEAPLFAITNTTLLRKHIRNHVVVPAIRVQYFALQSVRAGIARREAAGNFLYFRPVFRQPVDGGD